MIGGVVLAAGRSTRMGRPKLTLPMSDGRPMVSHAIDSLRGAGVEPIVVVTAPSSGIDEMVGRDPAITTVAAAGDGPMLASVQAGLRALEGRGIEAALTLPGDMPFVKTATVRRLVEVLATAGPRVVAPSFARHRGHPLGLARAVWSDILAMSPPRSLRDFLLDHRDEIVYVVVDDPGVLRDVDQPEDYKRATGKDPEA